MATKKYAQRREEDRAVLRELEIRQLETLIKETPREKRTELKMVVGDKTYTLDQILEEAKKGTEFGVKFLDMQAKSRLERLRRRK